MRGVETKNGTVWKFAAVNRRRTQEQKTPLVLSLSKDTMKRTALIHHALEGPPPREPCARAFDG